MTSENFLLQQLWSVGLALASGLGIALLYGCYRALAGRRQRPWRRHLLDLGFSLLALALAAAVWFGLSDGALRLMVFVWMAFGFCLGSYWWQRWQRVCLARRQRRRQLAAEKRQLSRPPTAKSSRSIKKPAEPQAPRLKKPLHWAANGAYALGREFWQGQAAAAAKREARRQARLARKAARAAAKEPPPELPTELPPDDPPNSPPES